MSTTSTIVPTPVSSAGDELAALGWEINVNQYRIVHAAARFDDERDWFRLGHRSASAWIAGRLQVVTPTAAEWVRVGHALRYLSLVDAAFAAQAISYAKVRIITRWADDRNEAQLLELARERSAGRLTVAIAKFLADDGESDVERDTRLHDERSFTSWTDADGSTVIRVVLAPSVAKPVVAAVDELVRRIAETPLETDSADDETLSADRVDEPSVAAPPTTDQAVVRQLDGSFVRLLLHDAEGRPINASSRRRHPTTRQKRVVMETHRHECVDCQSTELLELDHNPDFSQTRHTVVEELEPRCAPCHRARHRHDRRCATSAALRFV